jgi:uncharacterized protein with PhoU and TrkA domain
MKLHSVSYRPLPVKTVLRDMKDLALMMVDLAYSAVLFGEDDLAEEVKNLEELVDYLGYHLTINAFLAVRDAKDAEEILALQYVATATNKISDQAADIAYIVSRKLGVHKAIQDAFNNLVEDRVTRAIIQKSSIFTNKSLKKLDFTPRIGVDIIAIKRENKWFIDPQPKFVLKEGDVLIARGGRSGTEVFRNLAIAQIKSLEEAEKIIDMLEAPESKGITPTKEVVFTAIEEYLRELKDTSELIIDLAYSSILFNSKPLAEEVMVLEEYMDELHTSFELYIISQDPVKNEDDTKKRLGLIRLGVAAENLADAAAEMSEIILRGLSPHPILAKILEETDETYKRVEIAMKSPLSDQTLRDLDLKNNLGVFVIAIRRGKEWIFKPRGATLLRPGDTLICKCFEESVETFEKVASGEITEF